MAAIKSAPVLLSGTDERRAARINSSGLLKAPACMCCRIKASTSGLVISIVMNRLLLLSQYRIWRILSRSSSSPSLPLPPGTAPDPGTRQRARSEPAGEDTRRGPLRSRLRHLMAYLARGLALTAAEPARHPRLRVQAKRFFSKRRPAPLPHGEWKAFPSRPEAGSLKYWQ